MFRMSTNLMYLTRGLTVIKDPQRNVLNGLIAPGLGRSSSTPNSNLTTSGPSPTRIRSGSSTTALNKLVYHDSASALPLTTLRLCLITTEWLAVIAELATPKNTPTREMGVPSRKTPMKNPRVTTPHAKRMRMDGRECRTMKEVKTVMGRTSPRATG